MPRKHHNQEPIKVEKPKKHNWSEYQKTIFRDFYQGTGHTIILARAGSAKTSSVVEGSRYIEKGKKILFCAFNKSTRQELSNKLEQRSECLTLHSLGLRGIKQRFGENIEVDNEKCWKIVSSFIDEKDKDLIANICHAVDLCKATLSDLPRTIEDVIVKYNIDIGHLKTEEFIAHVIKAMRLCKEKTNSVDYNDMIWFCFVYAIDPGQYDFVIIDEAHDLNKGQIELALSACKKDGGRIIAVLDSQQAIYSWRGADSEVLDNLRNRLNPKELTLPICYRCPKRVVYLAQTIVPDIQSYSEAMDGEIIDLHVNDLIKHIKVGSYLLSRLNAPLIKHCLALLKNNIPANILGRDIGDNLSYIIKKSKKKSIVDFLSWLSNWESEEKAKLLAKYPKANTEIISDKAECIRALCEDAQTIKELNKNIDKLFKDEEEKNIVLGSSIHRIKGKESKSVFVLTDTFRYSSEEEFNLQYVSFTRSMEKLYLVYKNKPYNRNFDKEE